MPLKRLLSLVLIVAFASMQTACVSYRQVWPEAHSSSPYLKANKKYVIRTADAKYRYQPLQDSRPGQSFTVKTQEGNYLTVDTNHIRSIRETQFSPKTTMAVAGGILSVVGIGLIVMLAHAYGNDDE